MRKIVLVGLLTAAAACAQGISIGILGGAPLENIETTTTINSVSYLAKSPNFTLGPALQVNLPLHLRFEFDALVRPANFQASDLLQDNRHAVAFSGSGGVSIRFGQAASALFVGVGAKRSNIFIRSRTR